MLFIKTKCFKKIQYMEILFELTNIILIVTNFVRNTKRVMYYHYLFCKRTKNKKRI